MSLSAGFLFDVGDASDVQPALRSLESLRTQSPEARFTALTPDSKTAEMLASGFGNKVIVSSGDPYSLYQQSPFERTARVPANSFFARECSALFQILDHFDVGFPNLGAPTVSGLLPRAISSFSTEVLLFSKSPAVESLFESWTISMEAAPEDEAFAIALAQSKCQPYAFRANYCAPVDRPEKYRGWIHLVVGAHADIASAAGRMNVVSDARMWWPWSETCVYPSMTARAAQRCRSAVTKLKLRHE